jgi:hypothetical protein
MLPDLLNDIRRLVVEHYSRVDGKRALEMYKPLLNELGSSRSVIPIFTTNYDWIFECLAEDAEAKFQLVDGFRAGPLGQRWD